MVLTLGQAFARLILYTIQLPSGEICWQFGSLENWRTQIVFRERERVREREKYEIHITPSHHIVLPWRISIRSTFKF